MGVGWGGRALKVVLLGGGGQITYLEEGFA